MQMSSNIDKAADWFLSNSPSPEIHIFLPPDVLSSVSALPEQIIKYVLQHLSDNYPLFECSCTFTTDNSLKIIINNAHILGEKIEEHNGIIDFPEMREEIRTDVLNLIREIRLNSRIVDSVELTSSDKEHIRKLRIAADERLDLEEKITNLNQACKHIFKDGELFSLNSNGKTMDYIFIYNSRWEPIIKFQLKTANSFIMNATRIIFECKEIGFELGGNYINKDNLMKDKFGFAVQQYLDNSYFLNNSELRSQILYSANLLKSLDPQEHLVGNVDAIVLNSFKDGFAVGTFLRSQTLIDQEKFGVTPNYF